jgi:hypothetical protein
MAHQPTGGGLEEVEIITAWGPKTLMQTPTEMAVNGGLATAADGEPGV